MRAFFIFLSKSKWLQSIFTNWSYAWKIASRFVAGTTLAESTLVVKKVNAAGFVATLDHLGEQTESLSDAQTATEEIIDLIVAIKDNGVRSNVSIKLSQIGLVLDFEECKQNLKKIIEKAKQCDVFVRIDMEDSSLTDATLQLLYWAHSLYGGVGIVIQSYLFRSSNDVEELLNKGITMRLVKGAYKEPYSIAFKKKSDVDINYDLLTDKILKDPQVKNYEPFIEGIFPSFLGLGTHDDRRIKFGINLAKQLGLGKTQVEIQMLFGIRKDLQEKYVHSEYPVRLYIPYGIHWFPYFMRRLAERPANVWFFVSNFFHR